MPETIEKRRAKPAIRVGDIVFADSSWFRVTEKRGQRMAGELLVRDGCVYRFTSRRVERVFRELGVRAPR